LAQAILAHEPRTAAGSTPIAQAARLPATMVAAILLVALAAFAAAAAAAPGLARGAAEGRWVREEDPRDSLALPRDARDCKTEVQLREWREVQRAEIEENVPDAFQEPARTAVERAFEASLVRVAGARAAEAPQLLPSIFSFQSYLLAVGSGMKVSSYQEFIPKAYQHIQDKFTRRDWQHDGHKLAKERQNQTVSVLPKDCHDLTQLRAWRDGQERVIEEWVPEPFQAQSKAALRREYEANSARIVAEERNRTASAHTKAGTANASVVPQSLAAVGFQNFVPKAFEHFLGHNNASDETNSEQGIQDQYTGRDWQADGPKLAKEQTGRTGPRSANDCHNLTQLRAWRREQQQETEEWVPKMFQGQAKASLHREFAANRARILAEERNSTRATQGETREKGHEASPAQNGSTAPQLLVSGLTELLVSGGSASLSSYERFIPGAVRDYLPGRNTSGSSDKLQQIQDRYTGKDWQKEGPRLAEEYMNQTAPASPADCRTMDQLRAWRDHQRGVVDQWVPKIFQGQAEAAIKEQSEAQRAKIEALKKSQAAAEREAAGRRRDNTEQPADAQDDLQKHPGSQSRAGLTSGGLRGGQPEDGGISQLATLRSLPGMLSAASMTLALVALAAFSLALAAGRRRRAGGLETPLLLV